MILEDPVGPHHRTDTSATHTVSNFRWPLNYSHEMREKIKKIRNFMTIMYSPSKLTGLGRLLNHVKLRSVMQVERVHECGLPRITKPTRYLGLFHEKSIAVSMTNFRK